MWGEVAPGLIGYRRIERRPEPPLFAVRSFRQRSPAIRNAAAPMPIAPLVTQDPEYRCPLQVRLADSANWGGRGLRPFVPETCPFRLLPRSRSGLRAAWFVGGTSGSQR